MGKYKPDLKADIGETKPTVFEDNNIQFLENKVRFSLKFCDTNSYCISNLERNELEKLYKRLGYFEDLSWKQIPQIAHEDGFSIEKKDSSNHNRLSNSYKIFGTFLHFRVKGTDANMRVFAARLRDLCYILQFDREGNFNH